MSYFNSPMTAPYNTANLHAGIDPATGKPFYLAGYDAQMQPVFSWNPQFDAAEYGGQVVDRSSGHFADAMASGGQFGQLGEFVSNAQGSMYQSQPGTNGAPTTLQQTGSYISPYQGSNGGAGVNPGLQQQTPPPQIERGTQGTVPRTPTTGVGNRIGQPGVATQPHQQVQQPQQEVPDYRNNPINQPFFNQSGPNRGGASNYAVYGPQRGNYNRVGWQSRLQGGGGAANDRPGVSASRLF